MKEFNGVFHTTNSRYATITVGIVLAIFLLDDLLFVIFFFNLVRAKVA